VAVINDVFYLEVDRSCMLKLSVKYLLVLIIANMATVRNFLLVFIKFNVVCIVHNMDHIMEECWNCVVIFFCLFARGTVHCAC
jgi:hypothetical protein